MKQTIICAVLLALLGSLAAQTKIMIDTDLGLAFPGYNDVQIPNDDDIHTRFSLKDDLSIEPVASARLVFHYNINPRHRISLLVAPLKLSPEGSFDRDITFQNKTFTAGEEIKAVYRFDSYRLQYKYSFREPKWLIRSVGASLKVRDAEISLASSTQKAKKLNTGLVPLLSLDAGYRINEKLDAVLEAEGLGSPFGRAEDIYLGLVYDLHEKIGVKAGYRFLEGGSDGDEVYTFALIQYAVLGFRIRL
jgi:hypothetical protein